MSIILFITKACFRKVWFAMKMLEERCKNPVIMKNTRATFFIFLSVSDITVLIITHFVIMKIVF